MPVGLPGNRGRKPRWTSLRVTKVGTELVTLDSVVTRQTLANPHVSENGKLILAYGTIDKTPQEIGDRIFEANFDAPLNAEGLVSQEHFPLDFTTALAYPPVTPQAVDHLGAGAALAKGPDGRFYALTVVSDSANRRAWIAWAVRNSGAEPGMPAGWWFSTGEPSTIGNMTANPLLSTPIIRRADWAWQTPDNPPHDRWHHLAMRWDAREGNFLACIGYEGRGGLCATWWRIEHDANSPSGLGAVRRAVDGGPGVIEEDGDLWSVVNRWPFGYDIDAAADPSEIVIIDDELVFFYAPVAGVYASPTRTCYAAMGRMVPEPPQILDLSPVFEKWPAGIAGTGGSPGGNSVSLYQSGPNTLAGWIAVEAANLNHRQGLLALELEMVL